MPKVKSKTFRTNSPKPNPTVGNIKKIEKAVLNTLSYRAVFEYPLSFYQLSHFLITKKRVSNEDLRKALDYLLRTRKVSEKDGKYYLYRGKSINWNVRKKNSEKLIMKGREISKILEKIPWIQFVAITGAISAFNAPKNDDIDLFIVTKKGRLWITRGFVFAILKILGELRKDSDPNKKICPNILVDESKLAWATKKRNIYVAHEITMMYPLFDRDNTYFRLIKENDWIFKYFGNTAISIPEKLPNLRKVNYVISKLEDLARILQLKYMQRKKTSEITNKFLIHFNRDDSTQPILSEYEKILQKIK